MYLIHKEVSILFYILKLNNMIQLVYFATMQVEALLSSLLMIGLYSFFATRGSNR